MNTKPFLKITLAIAMVIIIEQGGRSEDIPTILDKIDSTSSTNADVSSQGASPNANTGSQPVQHKRASHSSGSGRGHIFGPKDKLPKEITGQRVAGNFAVIGEYADGGEMLVPAEDTMNPFARQFIIVNKTSGFERGTTVDVSQRQMIHVPRSEALVFISRGVIPGTYLVQAP